MTPEAKEAGHILAEVQIKKDQFRVFDFDHLQKQYDAIQDLMKQKKDKPFERFMLEFLKCDLNIGNIKTNIHNYINSEMSKSILTLILLKLVFYYRMRYFGTNGRIYNDIIDLIVELQIKLNPEKNNDLTKVFKGNKEIVRRKIASELDKAQNFDIHNL